MPTRIIASLAIVLTFVARSEALAACPDFSSAKHFLVGEGTTSASVGDFNRDGAIDLAVANHTNVSILLGKADGTFLTAANYSTGHQFAGSVAIGDLNRDGKHDLVATSYHPNANGVRVFLGQGDGTFAPAGTYLGGMQPLAVAVGDLDGDGDGDIAVVNPTLKKISVLVGDGEGKLALLASYEAGTAPVSLSIADVNSDGKADLAVSNQSSGNVSILLGTGKGAFAPAKNYDVGSTPTGIAIGDVNGDAKADLVVAKGVNMNNIAVLLGLADGSGSFAAATYYSAGTSPAAVAIGDFDRDGKNDLAVANQSSNTVSVLRGKGAGVFAAASTYTSGTTPTSVVIADFDKDGKSDLAVANNKSNTVSIFLNACTCP